ncbi:Dabb family protein [uncultured Maribacter sp.]|uniref:Dabb family protein n=1 Tax=uncultured Maribacter sp. TaxID=431308 RepID=UPI0030DDC6B8|tara:strand:+ start:978 stop:1268 length:291 start_codon:yes stop_codon:yes gene_type:complete
MIKHTVTFKLKYAKGSKEESVFMKAAGELRSIPGVENFECLRQISTKSHFEYALSMDFDSMQTYSTYSEHPEHTTFVSQYWAAYVEDFLELDFEVI